MEKDIQTATLRLFNIAKILQELGTDIFSDTLDGIKAREGVGRDTAEQTYFNCYDWMTINYELVATMINELSMTCYDMALIIDKYVTEKERR